MTPERTVIQGGGVTEVKQVVQTVVRPGAQKLQAVLQNPTKLDQAGKMFQAELGNLAWPGHPLCGAHEVWFALELCSLHSD